MIDKEMAKRFFFYSSVIDIVQIFGETELGSCEVDEEAVAQYCMSDRFWSDNFTGCNKEDFYQKITDDILSGMPVWEFLKVSDWTKRMLEQSFVEEKELKWRELCKKYKCYTCQFYNAVETGIGLHESCTYEKEQQKNRREFRDWRVRRDCFEPQEKCINYSAKK